MCLSVVLSCVAFSFFNGFWLRRGWRPASPNFWGAKWSRLLVVRPGNGRGRPVVARSSWVQWWSLWCKKYRGRFRDSRIRFQFDILWLSTNNYSCLRLYEFNASSCVRAQVGLIGLSTQQGACVSTIRSKWVVELASGRLRCTNEQSCVSLQVCRIWLSSQRVVARVQAIGAAKCHSVIQDWLRCIRGATARM